jgi:predicted helicase
MDTIFNKSKAKVTSAANLAQEWKLNMKLSRKEQKALVVISSHAGKRQVFEAYLAENPPMAEKYLSFIAKNPLARYVKWDSDRKKFTE